MGPGAPRSPRPPIWLGDAVRVLDALRPDTAATGRILALLGLAPPPAEPPPPAPPPVPPPVPGIGREPAAGPPARPSARQVVEGARPASAPPADLVDAPPVTPVLERVRRAPRRAPVDLPDLDAVLAPPPPARPPSPGSLLAPARHRAVLGAVCSSLAPTGEVDVDVLVERLARCEAVVSLPRRRVLSTRHGLQVLVDHDSAMVPFAPDQREAVAEIRHLAGVDGVKVLHFAADPVAAAGTGPAWTWRPYAPPAAGVPVLVLSDLGTYAPALERDARAARWVAVADLLRSAGCPLVALVPAPPARLHPAVRRSVASLAWDRTTGVRDAVAAARRAGSR